MKTNYLLKNISLVQQKKAKIDNDNKISDGHIKLLKIIWFVKKFGISLV